MKNKFIIKGDIVYIELRRRGRPPLYTTVSKSDLDKVKTFPYTWCAAYDPDTKSHYVVGGSSRSKLLKQVKLHRYILDTPKNLQVDHKNHDTLDNTRGNIWNCTPAQNGSNKRLQKNNTSGVTGVRYVSSRDKWVASFKHNGISQFVGYFSSIDEAEKSLLKAKKARGL